MSNATPDMEPARFHRYTLSSLLAEGTYLIEDIRLQTFLLWDEQKSMPLAHEQFSHEEMRLFHVVLSHSPDYCPHEHLYATYYNLSVPSAVTVLQGAWGTEEWDILMRPIRNLISRVRIKSRRLGISIQSMIDTGYMLVPAQAGIHAQRN